LDLGVQLNAPVHILVGAPDFQQDPRLLIGTHDGIYTLDDPLSDAPALVRWAPYQRVDDASAYFACRSCADRVEDPAAGLGELRALGGDGVATVAMRGESVAIYGTVAAGAAAELWIDGSWVATVDEPTKQPALLTRVDGLQPGWHAVEVRALADGVRVDAVSASSEGATFPVTERRGCASAQGAPHTLLCAAAAAFVLLRRRSWRFGYKGT
jgi:hypothetical protein